MKHFFTHQTRIFLIAALAVLTGLGAAWYVYTGPNRTVKDWVSVCKIVLWECQYIPAKGDWRYHQVRDWSCSNESKPWQDYPNHASACYQGAKANPYWSRSESLEETTITYPPAEISAQAQCSLPGQNGWCRGGAGLQLTGFEPVPGFEITAIEGIRNGESFAQTGNPATIPAVEGLNTFEYWAHSSFADTSLKGSSSLYLDSQPPALSTGLSGTNGSNGWYKSANLNASASDPSTNSGGASILASGLDGLAYSLNCASWVSFAGTFAIPDGIQTLQVRASDLAGNTALSEQIPAKVDSVAPTLAIAQSGTSGSSGWYISQAEISASAQDATSDVAALEYSLNNSVWTAYTSPLVLADGSHTLIFWAEDNAGWVTQETRSISVDTRAPLISGSVSGTSGTNGWYTSTVTLTATSSDPTPGSGIDSFTYALNTSASLSTGGGPALVYSAPLTLTDGQHSLTLIARDKAGLENT
ncbi:MAG: hypothetical protein L6461_11370, partial [Anaerolineae bacterium]|nr:hypothetical protein [Anaerolineae bacterium]